MIKRITTISLLTTVVGLSVWDVIAAANDPDNDCTISEIVRNGAKANPIIAFAMGVICGHWFWSHAEK